MTAKDYLSQAFRLDQRINSMLEQVASLRDMASKATASIHAGRVSGTKQRSPMEDAIVKLIDLEHEIDAEIDKLVDFKREVFSLMDSLEQPEHRFLLEHRYLHYKTWEEIAEMMNYSPRQILRIHSKALVGFEEKLLLSKEELKKND